MPAGDNLESVMRYPLIFDIKGRKTLFIGGGKVALRKIRAMLAAEAEITVIAPEILPEIEALGVNTIKKDFQPEDVADDCFLVFACTDSKAVNRLAAEEAKNRKIPVNIADDPEFSDFHTPAVITHDGFTLSVSTDGKSPSASKAMKEKLESILNTKK